MKCSEISAIDPTCYLRVSWVCRIIGASAHRRIGASAHRCDLDSSTHRSPPPDSLTPGLRPGIAHGLTGARELSDLLIPVSGLDGQTRPPPVSVSGWDGLTRASSAATPSHFLPRPERTVRTDRGRSLTTVRFCLRLTQRLWPIPIPMPAFLPTH